MPHDTSGPSVPAGTPGEPEPDGGTDASPDGAAPAAPAPSGGHSPAHSAAPSANRSAQTAGHRLGRGALRWLREIGTIVVIALVLSFLIKTFLFRAFFIPSGSMENTLEINDRIFVNELVPTPFALQRGDIVVFKDTQNWLPPEAARTPGPFDWVQDVLTFVGLSADQSSQYLVKRVIGMPGDHVQCCSTDGKITINGVPITEPYLYPGAAPSDTPFNVVVPAGELWVMGDHRNDSADSRAHQDSPGKGFVPISDVQGRAVVIALPLNRFSILGNYPQVFGDVPKPVLQSLGSPSAVPLGQ